MVTSHPLRQNPSFLLHDRTHVLGPDGIVDLRAFDNTLASLVYDMDLVLWQLSARSSQRSVPLRSDLFRPDELLIACLNNRMSCSCSDLRQLVTELELIP